MNKGYPPTLSRPGNADLMAYESIFIKLAMVSLIMGLKNTALT